MLVDDLNESMLQDALPFDCAVVHEEGNGFLDCIVTGERDLGAQLFPGEKDISQGMDNSRRPGKFKVSPSTA
jgi:hypothetical protein